MRNVAREVKKALNEGAPYGEDNRELQFRAFAWVLGIDRNDPEWTYEEYLEQYNEDNLYYGIDDPVFAVDYTEYMTPEYIRIDLGDYSIITDENGKQVHQVPQQVYQVFEKIDCEGLCLDEALDDLFYTYDANEMNIGQTSSSEYLSIYKVKLSDGSSCLFSEDDDAGIHCVLKKTLVRYQY